MREVRVSRRQVLKGAGAVGVLSALAAPTAVFADDTTVRWDVVSITNGAINSGGVASAKAKDGSNITVTGSGRFQPGDAENVTEAAPGRRSMPPATRPMPARTR